MSCSTSWMSAGRPSRGARGTRALASRRGRSAGWSSLRGGGVRVVVLPASRCPRRPLLLPRTRARAGAAAPRRARPRRRGGPRRWRSCLRSRNGRCAGRERTSTLSRRRVLLLLRRIPRPRPRPHRRRSSARSHLWVPPPSGTGAFESRRIAQRAPCQLPPRGTIRCRRTSAAAARGARRRASSSVPTTVAATGSSRAPLLRHRARAAAAMASLRGPPPRTSAATAATAQHATP